MSGRYTEKLANLLFGKTARPIVLIVCLLLTVFFGYTALTQLKLNTDLAKMVPKQHPYIQNYLQHRDDMNLGNNIRVIVEDVKHPDIFNQQYMQALYELTYAVRQLPGIDPSHTSSLQTPDIRWHAVTAAGFKAGGIVPGGYQEATDPQQIEQLNEQLRYNVLHSGQVGRLVANNFQSSIIMAELVGSLSGDTQIDIPALNQSLEKIRQDYQQKYPFMQIHIVGFAKQVGDIMSAAGEVADFFFLTLLVTLLLLLWDTRCLRSSLVVVIGSFVSVIWQLGIVALLGFTIDPYSMLVPFLVFAISVSHGVQIINAMVRYSAAGDNALTASKSAFTSLFLPGLTALLCDAIGFATLWIVHIEAIRELALSAGIGVAVIIITKLTLVPVLMSYLGCSRRACDRSRKRDKGHRPVAGFLAKFARPKWAMVSIIIAIAGYGVGIWYAQNLQIGDTGSGAPSLWTGPCVQANNCERGHVPEDKYQYNYDLHYLATHYSVSADVLVVMGETPTQKCATPAALDQIGKLGWTLQQVPGVQSVQSLASVLKRVNTGMNEGSPKWGVVPSNRYAIAGDMRSIPPGPLYNIHCSLDLTYVFLDDHKAETLERVTHAVSQFAQAHNNPDVISFELAAGNAGIAAATNQSIEKKYHIMLLLVYLVVIALCLIAFRSWRAMLCIVIPLGLTSILCEALMVWLDIGVKVATLPVIALGVGIGVDYGVYIFDKLKTYLNDGVPLEKAYYETMRTTGRAVTFTGLTLAVGVIFWLFSSIKFQADMGLLLTFMFIWNMIGALWLLPALASFLLKKKKPPRKKVKRKA